MVHKNEITHRRNKLRKIISKHFFMAVTIGSVLAITSALIVPNHIECVDIVPVVAVTTHSEPRTESNIKLVAQRNVSNIKLTQPQKSKTATPTVHHTSKYDSYIYLTNDEIQMLATLVYLEGGIESTECQQAIASVVVNRMAMWDMTLYEVIYQKNQFTPACMIDRSSPESQQINIVKDIVKHGPTIPEYVCYFRADYYHDWDSLNNYKQFDKTYFSYALRDYNDYMERSK